MRVSILGVLLLPLALACGKHPDEVPKGQREEATSPDKERRYSLKLEKVTTVKRTGNFPNDHRVEVRTRCASGETYIGRVDFLQPDPMVPEAVHKAILGSPQGTGEADIIVYHEDLQPEKIVAYIRKATTRQEGTLGLDCGPDQRLHISYVAAPASKEDTTLFYLRCGPREWKYEEPTRLLSFKNRPAIFDSDLVALKGKAMVAALVSGDRVAPEETGLFIFLVSTTGAVERWRVAPKADNFRLVRSGENLAILAWNPEIDPGSQYTRPSTCNVVAYKEGGWSDTVRLGAEVSLWGSTVTYRDGLIEITQPDGQSGIIVSFEPVISPKKPR